MRFRDEPGGKHLVTGNFNGPFVAASTGFFFFLSSRTAGDFQRPRILAIREFYSSEHENSRWQKKFFKKLRPRLV